MDDSREPWLLCVVMLVTAEREMFGPKNAGLFGINVKPSIEPAWQRNSLPHHRVLRSVLSQAENIRGTRAWRTSNLTLPYSRGGPERRPDLFEVK